MPEEPSSPATCSPRACTGTSAARRSAWWCRRATSAEGILHMPTGQSGHPLSPPQQFPRRVGARRADAVHARPDAVHADAGAVRSGRPGGSGGPGRASGGFFTYPTPYQTYPTYPTHLTCGFRTHWRRMLKPVSTLMRVPALDGTTATFDRHVERTGSHRHARGEDQRHADRGDVGTDAELDAFPRPKTDQPAQRSEGPRLVRGRRARTPTRSRRPRRSFR